MSDESPDNETAKLGTRPVDILTNVVPKLVAIHKEQAEELLEEKARIEKFCTNAVKRETESRKEKDELQRRLKEEQRQVRDREDNLKIREADFKTLQRKNQKASQKESKVSDAQLRNE